MLPFQFSIVPLMIKVIEPSLKTSGRFIKRADLRLDNPSNTFYTSLIVALVLITLYAITMLTPLGDILFAKAVKPQYILWVKSLFVITGAVSLVFGVVISIIAGRQRR